MDDLREQETVTYEVEVQSPNGERLRIGVVDVCSFSAAIDLVEQGMPDHHIVSARDLTLGDSYAFIAAPMPD